MSPRRDRQREARARPPTQTRHPWRATVRTVIIATIGAIPIIAELTNGLAATYGEAIPLLAQSAIITAIISRVLTTPAAEEWLARYIPSLAAEDYSKSPSMGRHAAPELDGLEPPEST